MNLSADELRAIAGLKHTLGGQALLKLAASKEEYWVKKLILASPLDAAENARLRAKIFAYQRLQDFLNMEAPDEGTREEGEVRE